MSIVIRTIFLFELRKIKRDLTYIKFIMILEIKDNRSVS